MREKKLKMDKKSIIFLSFEWFFNKGGRCEPGVEEKNILHRLAQTKGFTWSVFPLRLAIIIRMESKAGGKEISLIFPFKSCINCSEMRLTEPLRVCLKFYPTLLSNIYFASPTRCLQPSSIHHRWILIQYYPKSSKKIFFLFSLRVNCN